MTKSERNEDEALCEKLTTASRAAGSRAAIHATGSSRPSCAEHPLFCIASWLASFEKSAITSAVPLATNTQANSRKKRSTPRPKMEKAIVGPKTEQSVLVSDE